MVFEFAPQSDDPSLTPPIAGPRRYEWRGMLAAVVGWMFIAVAAWCALVVLP